MKRFYLHAPLNTGILVFTNGILVYVTNTYLVFYTFQYAICYQSINAMTANVREGCEVYFGISV